SSLTRYRDPRSTRCLRSEVDPGTKNPGAGGPRASSCSGAANESGHSHAGTCPEYVRRARVDTFSHPDYTVGSGISPDPALVLPLALAGSTAGQDLVAITRRPHRTPKA